MATTDPFERFQEWAIWFVNHRKQIPKENLQKRLDFHEKMLDGLMEIMAITIDHDRQARNFGKLYTPKALIIQDEHGRPIQHNLKG